MFEKLARLLARWHAELKNWHVFATLARQVKTLARRIAHWHVET